MDLRATILRIERISMNDGAGLRTVVFFKGCPLRCAWCAAPESQHPDPELYYKKEACTGCGRCTAVCPEGALFMRNGALCRDKELCSKCFRCVLACPSRALGVYGREMTVNQVFKEILKDEIFFFHSGGGVTLSGGDVLCYPEFAEKLLMECKDAAINTAAEMDLYGPFDRVERLLPWLDSFYADIKLMDPERHKTWTGVTNETILKNLRDADAQCRRNAIHARVPLIAGINDDEENLLATAEFCQGLHNCAELEFLPYHRLGLHGYEYLGREYPLGGLPAMPFEEAETRVRVLTKGRTWKFPVKISGREISAG